MSRPDGGPAFPTTPIYSGDDEVVRAGPGMSLRAYLAAQALPSVLLAMNALDVATIDRILNGETYDDRAAKRSVAIADALIAELSNG